MGGVDEDKIAGPVLPLINFLLGLKCSEEKRSIVSMNCIKEREGGNVRRMISQFYFLKSTLVTACPLNPTFCVQFDQDASFLVWQSVERSRRCFS